MAEKQVQKNMSLGDKVKLIDYAKKNPGVGTRRITEILKVKESIITDFETNASPSRKCSHSTRYQDIHHVLYKWYCLARGQLVPVSGPMLQAEALLLAEVLGSRESGDVREDTVKA